MNTQTQFYSDDFLYEVLKSRDRRFDGRFFFGVTSTGIYCRPVCPARRPRRENCLFFASAAAAENAGLRPCLRCHPELAPGRRAAAGPDAERLAHLAAQALEYAEDEGKIGSPARSLGVSDRHLRRVFAVHYGASPVQYAQTCRMLLARRLILETGLTFTQIASASGFGSIRRMNALFRERYRCNPTELRRAGISGEESVGVRLRIPFTPPYPWEPMLDFLRLRAVEGLEEVAERTYRRVLSINSGISTHTGWVEVGHDESRSALTVLLAPSLVPVLSRAIVRLKKFFDTDCRPEDVSAALGGMAGHLPGLRLPGCFDPFEIAVRAVLGQQITVGAARTLAGRLVAGLGEPVETPYPALHHTFPTPAKILEASTDTLGGMGIVRTRIRALRALAEAASAGGLEPRANVESQIEDLKKLPGIGEWTAQYIAMRALDWPDAFPHTDCGVKKAMPGMAPDDILKYAERWRPWRAYATMYLWAGPSS